jgi:hypothetical protein
MSRRAAIAHGGPQRLPTRAAPSLGRALRDARVPSVDSVDDPLRLDWPRHSYATYIHVGGADRRDHHAPGFSAHPERDHDHRNR